MTKDELSISKKCNIFNYWNKKYLHEEMEWLSYNIGKGNFNNTVAYIAQLR